MEAPVALFTLFWKAVNVNPLNSLIVTTNVLLA